MDKQKFIEKLFLKIKDLPENEIEERLNFYREMIDDRMEEGLSEDEAVSAIGTVDKVAKQIISEITISREGVKSKKPSKAFPIVLISIGSPIWLALAISAFAVIISLYVSLWSVIISLWAVFASLVICAIGGMIAGVIFCFIGGAPSGLALMCAAIVCAGLSIFLFIGCRIVTRAIAVFTKKIGLGIKNVFNKKGAKL